MLDAVHQLSVVTDCSVICAHDIMHVLLAKILCEKFHFLVAHWMGECRWSLSMGEFFRARCANSPSIYTLFCGCRSGHGTVKRD